MKTRISFVTLWLLVCSVAAFGQGQGQPPAEPVPPATETQAPDIPGVVKGGTPVKVIKADFQGTEGPIALPDGSLIFTEGNKITKIDGSGNTSTFLENTNNSNGLAFDAQGRLISVQTKEGATRIGVIYPKGKEAVLTDNFEGLPYARPNDLVVDKKGGVYFTDLPNEPPAPPAKVPPAVYYLPPGGKAIRIAEGIVRPNGIILSPDETVLYVNNVSDYLLAWDVQKDGSVKNRRNFAKYEGIPPGTFRGPRGDGLAVDSEGRIYAATSVGVQVFSPKGQHLGTIPVSRIPQNLAFAGPDKKTLYVVGRGAAYKIQMLSQGPKGRAK